MIIRKPYAVLIKYFKIIHIILFLLMTYMLFSMRSIYMFFSTFLKTGTYTQLANMVSSYVNIFMIISTIILISFSLLIFFLMRQKEKPVFYYISATIFYIVTFISLIIYMNVFNDLEFNTFSNQALVIYRDLGMILYYLNYLFLAIAFVRGFGFNIKKFNFEKDIKELDITDADREEIELSSGVDYEKVGNFLRKRKRNLGYYFKENSFVFIVLLVIIGLSTTAYISINKLVINKTYKEGISISTNDIDYKVIGSYLTNKDKYQNIIKDKNTYYLIVNLNIVNKLDTGLTLNINNTRVKIKNNYYYPVNNVSSKFNDIGIVYKEQVIPKKSNKDYIVIFELSNVNINSKMILELYSGKQVKGGEAIFHYKNVRLNPYIMEEKDIIEYKLKDKIDLSKTFLKKGEFSLNSYEVYDMLDYNYTKCSGNSCNDYKASVVASGGKKLLKIDYESNLENINIFNYLLNLRYYDNGKQYTVKSSDIKNVTPSNYQDDDVLIEVPIVVTDSSVIEFIFNLRGYRVLVSN